MNTIARPFGLLLMFLYEFVQNYALALFLIAVVIRVVLLPFQMKGKLGMMRQTRLQPKIAELQKKHGANKQKLNEEMAKLYREEKVNPASGCLWSFIQMPIMIALFYAIRQPLSLMMGLARELWEEGGKIFEVLTNMGLWDSEKFNGFYAEVYIAQDISAHWESFKNLGIEGLRQIDFTLGSINLTDIPNWQFFWSPDTNWSDMAWLPGLFLFMLPIISGGAQFLSAHIMRKMSPASAPDAAGGSMGKVMKFMPLMSVWFGFILPAALSFYWTIGTFLQIGQDIWLTKKYTKVLDAEDEVKEKERMAKEAELETKRLETERLKAEGLAERNRNTSKRKKQKSERQDQRERAAEWEKKNKPDEDKDETYNPSRVGNRRYARGRAYDPDRYSDDADSSGDKALSDKKHSETDSANFENNDIVTVDNSDDSDSDGSFVDDNDSYDEYGYDGYDDDDDNGGDNGGDNGYDDDDDNGGDNGGDNDEDTYNGYDNKDSYDDYAI